MPLGVSYMGTKRHIAPLVADIAASARPGPILDVFSGMCSVASAVAPARQVWTNDLQYFAWNVAEAFFCSPAHPRREFDLLAEILPRLSAHFAELPDYIQAAVASEDRALADDDKPQLATVPFRINSSGTQGWAKYTLFSKTFAGSYFGLRQAVEIDGLRRAIDETSQPGSDEWRWLILALCKAVSKCGTTTGHFAQPLTIKESSTRRFVLKRRRSIAQEWRQSLRDLIPVGSRSWRKKNRAFREEATELLDRLSSERARVGVIYADPPYTNDQYSRYYHLYETLILYDYPEVAGRGLYRNDREVSQFSLSTKVEQSIDRLISASAKLNADLILSYPTNGLLANSELKIAQIIRNHYRGSLDILQIPHTHSTMGASNGVSQEPVVEVIYFARR
jgi:adenine-specific DNA-methyltransferase